MRENRTLQIGVIGGGEANREILSLAIEIGRGIAKLGANLICGGLGGVMEAACKGAKQEGGLTIGVLPGFKKRDANPFIDIPIVTGISYARNIIIVRSSDVIVAIDGRYGTLTELGYALALNVPVVGLKTWDIPGIINVRTVEECMKKLKEIVF